MASRGDVAGRRSLVEDVTQSRLAATSSALRLAQDGPILVLQLNRTASSMLQVQHEGIAGLVLGS